MKSAPGSSAIRDHFLGTAARESLRGLHVAMSLDEAVAAVEAPATASRAVESMQYGNENPSRVENVHVTRRLTLDGVDFEESVELSFIKRGPGYLFATWMLAFQTGPKTLLRDVMAALRAELEARYKAQNKSTFQFVHAKRKNVVFISAGPKTAPSYVRMTLTDPEF
jgi:hypothetical protein